MRIVIVGPGALGSLLATRLAHCLEERGTDEGDAHDLQLLDYREERAAILREKGLLLEEEGRSSRCRVRVETDPETCAGCDVLFLCVKSTGVEGAVARLSPFLSPATLLIAMQNGIAHLDVVRSLPCTGAVAVTSEGANMVAPGHVRHGGKGVTRIGIVDRSRQGDEARLPAMSRLLNEAGLETIIVDDPLKYVWEKLFVNVGVNALTAIYRCPNGELLRSQETLELMTAAVNEAVAVARALDIPVEGDPVRRTIEVCESTAKNLSSMYQDVHNRRRTEIDAINGAVVALGGKAGIPTPVNSDLVRRVKEIEETFSS
ncbi:MAG: 2-dehydropantoate 2-reductase [Desulfobulbaceae bacterium]